MDTLLGPSSRGGKPRPSKGLFHSLVRFGKSAGRLHQLNWWTWTRDKRRPLIFHKAGEKDVRDPWERTENALRSSIERLKGSKSGLRSEV